MQSSQDLQLKIEPRMRTIRTLWIAMLLSIGSYYVFTFFIGQPKNSNPNNALFLMLLGIGLLTTLIAVPIKKKLLAQSVEQQRVELVQQGYVIAWAISEVAALLGVLDFFLTGNRYYYVLFLIAAIGQLLNFPRRQDLLAACFKNPTF